MSSEALEDCGKLLLRVLVAGLMLFHGVDKLVHGPGHVAQDLVDHALAPAMAYGVYLGEVLAPLLMIAGVLTRMSAVVYSGSMAFATPLVHSGDSTSWRRWRLRSSGPVVTLFAAAGSRGTEAPRPPSAVPPRPEVPAGAVIDSIHRREARMLRTSPSALRAFVAGLAGAGVMLLATGSTTLAGPSGSAFSEKSAEVNGVRLHYRIGGTGSPVVLLHGYAQTGHMWHSLMPLLADRHTVIVPDLRGAGASSKPESGYDKKTMAVDVHGLTRSLGFERVSIVGHDIGLMVAYAYAAQFPRDTDRVILMDAFLPGIGSWEDVWLLRDLWHFHFYGEVPLALVKGRERTYFEHFWNDFAADPKHSVPEADRQLYAGAYAQPGGMRAGFEYFRTFEQDARDFAQLSADRLAMPMLVLTGEKASGQFLIDQARMVATNVKGVVIKGSGHWLVDEAFDQVAPQIVEFLDDAGSLRRLDPAEIQALAPVAGAVGTSGLSEIETRVLSGDPTEPGPYTIQLEVPANTRIEAHDHPDDRFATVVSGTWYIGYGSRFDETQLEALAPGSFYTEPPNSPHFARTGSSPAVVRISGFGPSGTHYVEDGGAASADRKGEGPR